MRRFLSLILALAMLLTLSACGGGEDGLFQTEESQNGESRVQTPDGVDSEANGQTLATTGRYVETDITPQALTQLDVDYIHTTQIRTDGAASIDLLGYYGKEGETVGFWYHSDDKGDTWEERSIPGEWTGLFALYLDSKGGLYCLGYADEEIWGYSFPANGTESSYVLRDGNIGNPTLLDSGYLIYDLQDTGTNTSILRAVDASSGEVAWSYTADTLYLNWMAADGNIYVSDSGALQDVLDGATGEKIDTFDLDTMLVGLSRVLWADSSVYFYLDEESCNLCRGIYGQSLVECILENDEYRYASEMDWPEVAAFGISEDQTIYMDIGTASTERDAAKLYRYDFDENAVYASETLTVWALEESDTLRQAALTFREAHPEVQVEFQVPDVADDAALNDALTALNTKLLAGDGPDILLLDGTSYESYMEKGVLSDLTELYEETDFVGQTVSALLDESGRCYVIPARFTVPILFSDGLTPPEGLEGLLSAVKAATSDQLSWTWDYHLDTTPLTEYGIEALPYLETESSALYNRLWAACAPVLVQEDGVDEAGLRLWLQTLKEIGDYYGLFCYEEIGAGESSYGGSSLGYGNREVMYSRSSYNWRSGFARAGTEQLDAVETIASLLEEYCSFHQSVPQSFQITQFPGLVEGVYTPKLLMAVSAASEQQTIAMEFLKTVLSLEVQQYTYGDGLPVLQEAMDRQLDYFADYAKDYGWNGDTLTELFESRTTPVITDQTVSDVIYQAANDYCMGGCTLDEAVSEVQSNLTLKLAEK